MKTSTWLQLTPRQQHVLLVAIYVRNAMEDFHVRHLTDAQMKEINMIVRQGLYDIVSMIEDDDDGDDQTLNYLVAQIPDYWEIPSDGPSILSPTRRHENDQAA